MNAVRTEGKEAPKNDPPHPNFPREMGHFALHLTRSSAIRVFSNPTIYSRINVLSSPGSRSLFVTMPTATTHAVNGVSEDRPNKAPEKLILCFDGTGNSYSADTSDTNVVKLFQKFDRQALGQYHYYQRECVFCPLLCRCCLIQLFGKTDARLSLV